MLTRSAAVVLPDCGEPLPSQATSFESRPWMHRWRSEFDVQGIDAPNLPQRPEYFPGSDCPAYAVTASATGAGAGLSSSTGIALGTLSCNSNSVASTCGSAWKYSCILSLNKRLQTASKLMP